jgi:NAD(P)-dependent dehydrogenase (short-subunit alcohol dehydrogenase family)
MNDLATKTILITGATDGLGKGIALDLARRRATVLVHGRDPARADATASDVLAAGATAVRVYLADLSSLDEVRALAKSVLEGEPRIDVLVNNAGIGVTVPTRDRATSKDGHELRFAVNYLSHYLLTSELLPLLARSAPARIVNVSSLGQAPIDFDDVMLTRSYTGAQAYCQSKLAQILETVDRAPELAKKGVTVNALHPATYMPTKMVPNPISTLEEGVNATVRLIADPALEGVTGKYFNGIQEAQALDQAYDAKARAALRELSDRLVGK